MPDNINDSLTAELILFPGCDPENKLSDLFDGDRIASKPELVILNWLVALPTAIDPALAAQSVLIKLETDRDLLTDDQKNIIHLLGEIACHPREKLLSPASGHKRGHRRRYWLKQTRQRTFFKSRC